MPPLYANRKDLEIHRGKYIEVFCQPQLAPWACLKPEYESTKN